jgi:KaiC/GvpD/RAD55 family RecA-like ATPase
MGLLAKVDKKKVSKTKTVKTKKESKKIKPQSTTKTKKTKLALHKLKEKVHKQIQKQEHKSVKKHSVKLKGGKVQILRPLGSLNNMKKPNIDLESIRKEVQGELTGKTTNSSKIKLDKDRVQTGIEGLDEVMEGGFRKESANLVAGGPGTGKSIFAMQFLAEGIEKGENGLYISFEQTPEEIIRDMDSFGWKLQEKIKKEQLTILSYSPEQVENVLRAGGGSVRDIIRSTKAKRVVIDSLTAFTLLHKDFLAQRRASIDLFQAIKKWGCTALMLSEHENNPELHDPTVEEFEVDGVILLYNLRKGDVRERALEIFKMRATKHSPKIFPMTIGDEGIIIYPDETVF